ncbi:DUF2147 domain-containing protein [Burkholderia cepacia]|uniref:DUF2147 domain-containing protein n=1 Tax=Burkholderia cepacia TaxID=292 RepID=UPI000753A8CA|nr:DUF2147 domain-containing protein [Burkholderia cepacia]KVH40982.1 hypothetical protein WS88_05090 [Burkholderia cepacia]
MQFVLKSTCGVLGGLALCLASGRVFAQSSLAGTWRTIDDTTGEPRGEVRIVEQGGVFTGTLINVLKHDERDKICTQCVDDRKGKPILGMTILMGMKPAGDDEWSGGTILDPENGKFYSAKMSLSDSGKRLKVRGFIGISLLGRTQTWIRE